MKNKLAEQGQTPDQAYAVITQRLAAAPEVVAETNAALDEMRQLASEGESWVWDAGLFDTEESKQTAALIPAVEEELNKYVTDPLMYVEKMNAKVRMKIRQALVQQRINNGMSRDEAENDVDAGEVIFNYIRNVAKQNQ